VNFSFVDAADERDSFPLDVKFRPTAFFENRDPPFVRAEIPYSFDMKTLMRDPGTPESPFCAVPAWPEPTGRIAELVPAEFRKNRAPSVETGTRWPHLLVKAWRSKPEGRPDLVGPPSEKDVPQSFEAGPSPERSRAIGGRAVLTLKSSYLRSRPNRDQQFQ